MDIIINETTQLLRPEEMAARMRVSLRTLRRLSHYGLAPKPLKVGRQTFYVIQVGTAQQK